VENPTEGTGTFSAIEAIANRVCDAHGIPAAKAEVIETVKVKADSAPVVVPTYKVFDISTRKLIAQVGETAA
jgi:hypothetical protein